MWLEVIFGCFTLILLWKMFAKPSGLPPGYWGLPLIGYVPLNRKDFTKKLIHLYERQDKDPVISWRLGTKLVVFVFDPQILEEAYSGEDFVDRPSVRSHRFLGGPELGNETGWQPTRKFTLRHLRDSRTSLVPAVQLEAQELVGALKDKAGSATMFPTYFAFATQNIIWQMVAGKRYGFESEEINKFHQSLEGFRNAADNLTLVDHMPWLKTFLPTFIFKRILNEDIITDFDKNLKEIITKNIEPHEEKLDHDDPKDFIEAYLIEMKSRENDEDSTFTLENMTAAIGDFLVTGTETVYISLTWMILYLIKYPEVQKKLQKMVESVVQEGNLPSLEDKLKLSYVDAFINEVQRHSNFVKFGADRAAAKDTHLGGYRIPKGTLCCRPTFWTNIDPELWDKPDEFMPERFLDSEGEFVVPNNGFCPFGVGKRQCIAEPLARLELFMFLVACVQNLEFGPAPGKEISLEPLNVIQANLPNTNQEIFITIRE